MGELQLVPARGGNAVRVNKGQAIRMINTHGHQVVDTWIFNAENLDEYMSMEHLRQKLSSIFPKLGEPLFSNLRNPMMIFEEDTSPGIHDTLMAACDIIRYRQLGVEDYHENCHDNLHAAMAALGLKIPRTPAPLNMWMNIPVGADNECGWLPPVSKPGDYVTLRAEMDCIVAMSACPQDMVPVNAGHPVETHFEIID